MESDIDALSVLSGCVSYLGVVSGDAEADLTT